MARFIAGAQGGRGDATRLGTTASGVFAYARGWNSGVHVRGHVTVTGDDEFHVYMDGGSHNKAGTLIGTVTVRDGKPHFTPA